MTTNLQHTDTPLRPPNTLGPGPVDSVDKDHHDRPHRKGELVPQPTKNQKHPVRPSYPPLGTLDEYPALWFWRFWSSKYIL